MIQAVATVRAMSSYALAELSDAAAISLAQNESLRAPSPKALEAGQAALTGCQMYPDPDWTLLRHAIATAHPVTSEQVLCGAGSMELIGGLIRAFAGPGDDVIGTQFGYAFLATATRQAGANYIAAPEIDYRVDIHTLLAEVTPATRLVCVCNPGNPTGTRLPNSEILRLREMLRSDILLLVDQAYAEFDDQDHAGVFRLVDRGDTVVTRTLSKAYGLAGARAGWGAFPVPIGAEVRKLLNPNNIAYVSQAMAQAAMKDQGYMRQTVALTGTVRDQFTARVRSAGYAAPSSATNFVLIPFKDVGAAMCANTALLNAGYILRGMGGYGLPQCLRATVGTQSVMMAVADVLEEIA